MKCYSFDVDETLEISNGPIKITDLWELKKHGHILGLCGNYAFALREIHDWYNLFSFIVQMYMTKEAFLYQLKTYVPCEEVVHVGNEFGRINSLGFKCGSHDRESAVIAGIRFILEDDFANGVR